MYSLKNKSSFEILPEQSCNLLWLYNFDPGVCFLHFMYKSSGFFIFFETVECRRTLEKQLNVNGLGGTGSNLHNLAVN